MSAVSDSAVFRKASPLLFGLTSDVHPERWRAAGLTPEAGAALAGCPRSRLTLSRDLSWTRGGAEAFDWSEWDAWAEALRAAPGEWALLSGGELWRRGMLFGAGCFRGDISRLVFRADIEAFRRAAGGEAHTFALRAALMVWRGSEFLPGLPAAGSVAEKVAAAAALALGCWLAGLPAGLSARVRMKLPLACDAGADSAAGWPEERRRGWVGMLGKVFALSGRQ